MSDEELIKALRCWTGTIVKDEECAKCSFVDTCTLEDIVDLVEVRLKSLRESINLLQKQLEKFEFPFKKYDK